MSFDARQNSVSKLLNDAIYRIPRNQRPYVWEESNWNDLLRDMKFVAENRIGEDSAAAHFLGSIVLKREGEESGLDTYTIIDGQQRILTLTILLCAMIFLMKKNGQSADADGTRKYIIATNNKGTDVVIVDPEHHLTLPRIVERVALLGQSELQSVSARSFANECCVSKQNDKKIIQAFQYFCIELSKLTPDQLVRVRDAVVSTQYVNITSSTDEDLYTIFEILNARGLPLKDSDLLKNYIMRYIHPKERRDDAKVMWKEIERTVEQSMDAFLRHYAIHRCRFTSAEKMSVYQKIRENTNPDRALDLLFDLRKKASYYHGIINPMNDTEAGKVLAFFRAHRVQIFRPLILSLMHLRELERITESTYVDSLDFIYKFYICYKVIGGLESNQLTDSIAKYSFALERQYKDCESLSEWKNSFILKLPSEASFKRSFESLGWSHCHSAYSDNRKKDQCRVVLELMESQLNPLAVLSDYSIEHVLPDSQNEENATIGNLLPLEKELNGKCGDLSLEMKLDLYRKSRFALTRAFADRFSKEEFHPQKRTRYLSKYVYKLLG